MLEQIPNPTKTIKDIKVELDLEKVAQGLVGRIRTLHDDGQTKFRLSSLARELNISQNDAKKAIPLLKRALGANYKVSGGLIGKEIIIEVKKK